MNGLHHESFLNGKQILLTGSTGMLGKIVLAKIFQRHTSACVHLLIRPKMNRTPVQRLKEEIFANSLFDAFSSQTERMDNPNIVVVSGDILKDDIGLSLDDQIRLTSKINVVIHCKLAITYRL